MKSKKRRYMATMVQVAMVMWFCGGGCGSCLSGVGRDAAEKLAEPVTKLVEELPGLVDKLDATANNVIKNVNDLLKDNIQAVSSAIHQQVDGINHALNGTIDHLDAVLAARIQQLTSFINDFIGNLNQILQGTIDHLTVSADMLLARLQTTGTELLDAAGFNVVRVLHEGGKLVAVVIGGVVETVILIVSWTVFVLALLIGGIFFVRMLRQSPRPALQQWIPGTAFFGVGVVIGALFVFIPSVRASVASGRVVLSNEDQCTTVLPEAGVFVGQHRDPLTAATDKTKALDLLSGLYACEAEASTTTLRDQARELASDLHRLMGLNLHCHANSECDVTDGEHCMLSIGLCTTRCMADSECTVAGDRCHISAGGVCGPSCRVAADCHSASLTCGSDGQCKPTGGTTGTGGTGTGHKIDIRKFLQAGYLNSVVSIPRKCLVDGCGQVAPGTRVVDPAKVPFTDPALLNSFPIGAIKLPRITVIRPGVTPVVPTPDRPHR